MRRLLLVAFTSILLIITYKIFCNGVVMDVLKVSVYVSFSGLIGFMLNFILTVGILKLKISWKLKIKKGLNEHILC